MADEIIGGYRVRGQLGAPGQVSQVLEVVEPASSRHFAMKLLHPQYAKSREHRRQLFHEADVGIKMRHENVINILKVNKSPNQPHFIMEYFPSGSLRTRLQSRDPKDMQFVRLNAKKIFKQIATGLAYMNASGIVHCDVKADNILVNALGQTKIIDFAIAKRIQTGFFAGLFKKRGKAQGTPSFMSPEQITGKLLDGRADIYSYAATLYELTTGRPPYRGNSVNDLLGKHLVEKPTTPQMYNPDLTDEFSALIVKCLAKKMEDRPANFHEILIELKKIKVFKSIPDAEEEEQWG